MGMLMFISKPSYSTETILLTSDNPTFRAIPFRLSCATKERNCWRSERGNALGEERGGTIVPEGCSCVLNDCS